MKCPTRASIYRRCQRDSRSALAEQREHVTAMVKSAEEVMGAAFDGLAFHAWVR